MSEIPHPFIEESTILFDKINEEEQRKIHFIHLNHTNPLLDKNSEESKIFDNNAYHIAHEGQIIDL